MMDKRGNAAAWLAAIVVGAILALAIWRICLGGGVDATGVARSALPKAAALVFLLVVASYDWKYRIIPNRFNALAAACALLLWGVQGEWAFVLKSLALGLGIGVFCHALGLIGAGDAKALAALSGLVGADAAFLTVACALVVLAAWAAPMRMRKLGLRGFLNSEKQGLWYFFLRRRLRPGPGEVPPEIERVPLAPFFVPGFAAALLLIRWGF
jgi:Flp pilus assembly protein protease CpaA